MVSNIKRGIPPQDFETINDLELPFKQGLQGFNQGKVQRMSRRLEPNLNFGNPSVVNHGGATLNSEPKPTPTQVLRPALTEIIFSLLINTFLRKVSISCESFSFV